LHTSDPARLGEAGSPRCALRAGEPEIDHADDASYHGFMSVESASPPPSRWHGLLDALFGEARARQRRRRRRRLLVTVVCLMVSAVLALTLEPGASAPRVGVGGLPRVAVVSRGLPILSNDTELQVVGGRLMLIDYGRGTYRSAGGAVCRVAIVDPHSLRLVSVATGACDDPALFDERVMKVYRLGPPPQGALEVHIARISARVKAGYSLGPVVFSYEQCSDCWDESVQGARSLWIYAPFDQPIQRQTRGELFRISLRTGRVLERWSMPSMVRVLLAVDDDGLWIAPSVDTGGPNVIYRVAPGMRTPSKMLALAAPNGERFLIARGHTVWFETLSLNPGGPARLWRIQGTRVTVRGTAVSGDAPCTNADGTGAPGPVPVLANGTLAVYCTVIGKWSAGVGTLTQNVIRVVPERREQQQVATVTPPPGSYDIAGAVALNGSCYFLDPPTNTPAATPESRSRVPSVAHAAMLFRVTPR